jgi:hypothetical protein
MPRTSSTLPLVWIVLLSTCLNLTHMPIPLYLILARPVTRTKKGEDVRYPYMVGQSHDWLYIIGLLCNVDKFFTLCSRPTLLLSNITGFEALGPLGSK